MSFRSVTSQPGFFEGFLAAPPRNETLRQLKTLLDWGVLREVVAPAYRADGPGRKGYDPVLLIKILLLQRLYKLSDPQAEEEVADRLSFREFLELRAGDPVPDETTLVKFRERLRKRALLDAIYDAIEAQLAARGVTVRPGAITMVDATLIRAATKPPVQRTYRVALAEGELELKATLPADPDARLTGAGGKPHYGYKLHLAQDAATGLIGAHCLTAANVTDVEMFSELLQGDEAEVLADRGYHSAHNRAVLRAQGTHDSIMRRAARAHPLTAGQRARNQRIARVRGRVEIVFATLKRYLDLERMRYRGLQRCWEHVTLSVLMFNLKRACALMHA